jgi:hypothetical protein
MPRWMESKEEINPAIYEQTRMPACYSFGIQRKWWLSPESRKAMGKSTKKIRCLAIHTLLIRIEKK